jgi:hypothetical protein
MARLAVLAAALMVLLAAAAPAAAAPADAQPSSSRGPSSPPNPPLDGDLFIAATTKLFQPWGNDSSALEGSSYAIGASLAHVRLGPCVYRAFHWHSAAWEIFTLVHGEGPIRSFMIEPGQEQRSRQDTLHRGGESIAYPAGWPHYQLNDGCKNATALLVWNAVHSGGVNNVPQQVAALPEGYKEAAVPRGTGLRQGYWLRDGECARRCGLLEEGEGEEAVEAGVGVA